MDGVRVPADAALAVSVKVLWSPVLVIVHVMPVEVPPWVISDNVNVLVLIGSEKTIVNRIGKVVDGSACPVALLTVTVGGVTSVKVTELSVLVLA